MLSKYSTILRLTFVVCLIIFLTLLLINHSKMVERNEQPLVLAQAQEYEFGIMNESKIPRIIWTFWNEEILPHSIDLCIQLMEKHNPTHKVIVMNSVNIKEYLPEYFSDLALQDSKIQTLLKPFKETHQRLADFVRVKVLEKHGGIWLDSTIILTASLDWVHATQVHTGSEYIGYYNNGFNKPSLERTSPVIENWFMACIPGSKFVSDWAQEFSRLSEFSNVEEYIHDLIDNENVDLQNIPEQLVYYLSMHAAAQKILQRQNSYLIHMYIGNSGPFKYLDDYQWKSGAALDALFNHPEKYLAVLPVIKLRGCERKLLKQSHIDVLDKLVANVDMSNKKKTDFYK